MFQTLKNIDHNWFRIINEWNSSWVDPIMIFITDQSWFVVLGILFFYSVKKYKSKFWIPLVLVALSWGLADFTSSKGFKNNIKRLRPCHTELHSNAHIPLKEGCGGKYGFVSSHAANSATITVIIIALFNSRYRFICVFWSLLISYSRIYLGKHYPADVICGTILGIFCGVIVLYIFKKYFFTKLNFDAIAD